MAVLGCRSIVLVIRIIIRKRWRNLGFSQSAENFENIYVILQKTIEYLNTIKRYSGRLFIKFERNKGSFEISFSWRSIKIFTNFLVDLYYEPLAWFMITGRKQVLVCCTFSIFLISRV